MNYVKRSTRVKYIIDERFLVDSLKVSLEFKDECKVQETFSEGLRIKRGCSIQRGTRYCGDNVK